MNTKISYLYRDADNYKMSNECVIIGTLTAEQAHTKRFYNEEKHFRTALLCRLFLAAQPVLSDICVQQGVAYQSREGRIGLLSKADRYLMTLNGQLDLPGVFLLCALI